MIYTLDFKINTMTLMAFLGNALEYTNDFIVVLVSVTAIGFNSIRFYEIYKRMKDKGKDNG